MPNENNDRPLFLITQHPSGSGHPRRRDAVIDYPLQLPVGIGLYVLGSK